MSDYCIEADENIETLVGKVNELMRNGYVPMGGPLIWCNMIAQALVLNDDKENDNGKT